MKRKKSQAVGTCADLGLRFIGPPADFQLRLMRRGVVPASVAAIYQSVVSRGASMPIADLSGNNWRVIVSDVLDALRTLPDESVQCVVTSPPYFGLRDYGVSGQIGLEKTPEEYVSRLAEIFREVKRVLRSDGTCWVNMGDSYASSWPCNRRNEVGAGSLPNGKREARPPRMGDGLKEKDLMGMPWRLAFALQSDGWYLRQDIIWAKKNTMPESVNDRCTKSHEYIFLLTKSARYFYDAEAVKEPCSPGTHARVSQDVAAQVGSARANGGAKSNGPMKAVISGSTRKLAEAGSGTKNNSSFNAAVILQVTSRNLRSVWHIGTEPYSEAHFATFPSEIPRRCILAGTSEKGCCVVCDTPWVRVTDNSPAKIRRSQRTHESGRTRASGTMIEPSQSKTTGWKPDCACGVSAEIVPCIVLDPFSGSGTTGMVATEFGRQYIGIELNPDYAEMSRKRIESWKYRDIDKQPAPLPGQKELF